MADGYSPQELRGLLARQNGYAVSFIDAAPISVDSLLSDDSRQFFTAWKTWRGDKLLPQRRDIDLVSIARLMPKLALLDVFSRERMILRLAGGDLEAMVGQRLTGRDYIAAAAPEERATRSHTLWAAATLPCGALSFHAIPQPDSAQPHYIEIFALPVLPDDQDPNSQGGAQRAPMQLMAVMSRLPGRAGDLKAGVLLEKTGVTRHFIDLGAGLPPSGMA